MMSTDLFPALFTGLFLVTVLAAIMSTADSQLLVAASTVVRDVYEKVLRRGRPLTQRRLVVLSRIVVTALVLAALALGRAADQLVFWLVLFAWAGLGAALGPTSILALFWRRTTRAGVFAGLAAGTLTTVVWYLTPALKGALYELIPAFAAGLLATILVSLATIPPAGTEEMFRVMRGAAARAYESAMRPLAMTRSRTGPRPSPHWSSRRPSESRAPTPPGCRCQPASRQPGEPTNPAPSRR